MTDQLTIYQSDPDVTIERLAQLDSQRCPRGRVLVAAVAGEPWGAVPLDGGRTIANPFRHSTELLRLLELRATQLNAISSPRKQRRLATVLRRPGIARLAARLVGGLA